MPIAEPQPDPAALRSFVALCGDSRWLARVADLGQRVQNGAWRGRAAQQRHVLELMLARLGDPKALARAGSAERRVLAIAREAVRLAESLPAGPRARLRETIAAGLEGEATLIPLFHLLRTASLHRDRGFEVTFAGLASIRSCRPGSRRIRAATS